MTSEPEVISQVSEEVSRRLKRAGLPENKANIAGLAVEEMAVYTSQITYDYIMGMNSTHIVLDTKRS